MRDLSRLLICGLLAVTVGFMGCTSSGGRPEGTDFPEEISGQVGITLHLGAVDGQRSVFLGTEGSSLIHALDTSEGRVKRARGFIRSKGLYGDVSVDLYDGRELPYVDNLINQIIVDDQADVPDSELMRVLVPNGVLFKYSAGRWEKSQKERPAEMDEWTHFLHSADNNAVAQDTLVGPPRRLQWAAGPLWLRSHETPSGVQNLITGDGKMFYFLDEGLIGITDPRLPARWSLVCRDAFNGKMLWKKDLEPWGWREWANDAMEGKDWTAERAWRTVVPDQNQRRMVIHEGTLIATLGFDGPVSFLNPTTGETKKTISGTEGALEIVASEGTAVVFVANETPRVWPVGNMSGVVIGVDCDSGKVIWKQEVEAFCSLQLAIKNGRVVYTTRKNLACLDLENGRGLWTIEHKERAPYNLIVTDSLVLSLGSSSLSAYSVADGRKKWSRERENQGSNVEKQDLFLSQGLVWEGVYSAGEEGEIVRKSDSVLAVGLDPETGEERKRIAVDDLRSPEHHHRCYRNKATDRYLMTALEGVEFVDLVGDNHSQDNFVRGSCKYGIMPSNGLLYVPPDQCFCQPGAKLLGFSALAPAEESPFELVSDGQRLTKGPGFGNVSLKGSSENDAWPTYRNNSARWGSTEAEVKGDSVVNWSVELGGTLTAPVASGGKVYVARVDAHTLHAFNGETGSENWSYIAGGRIDSPPTIHKGLVLFGGRDGRVYCLNSEDGTEVWTFLAAPADRRLAYGGQIESTWPVHGSILVRDDIAYFSAGRSTYLDGGIRLFGVDVATGEIVHKGLLDGPHPQVTGDRDVGFYILGANSDLLVSEGDYVYMRQKKLSLDLDEVEVPVLSSKGAQDVGLHIFSTSGLLDGSWYNRTFWMYTKRWPGFQLANQAPKTGQLLVVDEDNTYAVRVFYRRNVHSPMFFPGSDGYLLFADENSNEPQIVGEDGTQPPVEWLPQSEYERGKGRAPMALDSDAFGADKLVGYSRAEPPLWTTWVKVRVRAMVKAGDSLYAAGPPDVLDEEDPFGAFEGRKGGVVVKLAAADGRKLSEMPIDSPPVTDGLIAAYGHLYMSSIDGSVSCLGGGGLGK